MHKPTAYLQRQRQPRQQTRYQSGRTLFEQVAAECIARIRPANILLVWLGITFSLSFPLLLSRLTTPNHAGYAPTPQHNSSASAPRQTITDSTTIYLPHLHRPEALIQIAAAHIDSSISGEPDEAILLWNTGSHTQNLAGWRIVTQSRSAAFPDVGPILLGPGQRLWCTAQADAFLHTFGEWPGCVWAVETPGLILLDNTLRLANGGGYIQLRDGADRVVDALLYGDTDQTISGWSGMPAQLYTRGAIGGEGQLWQRKRGSQGVLPIDSNRATDWAGDLLDLAEGRQVYRPGWQGWMQGGLMQPSEGMAAATVTVAVGPEGLYAPVANALQTATTSIDLNIYALEHPQLAQILAAAVARGVQVRVLLEGSPPGGISDLQRWCVAQIAAAGGEVRYLAPQENAPKGYAARYRFAHAKFGIIDQRLALNGTENFTLNAMPLPSGNVDGPHPGGRRGYYLLTDAPPVVQALTDLFHVDWDPDHFLDLQPYDPAHGRYGGPPPDFVLPPLPAFAPTDSPFAEPISYTGPAHYMVVSAPENATRHDSGLHALLQRAGPGDEILVEQLYEHKYWGDGDSNPIADPNPRLQMIIDAARRGARVRVLLDAFFDDAESLRSNQATVEYLHALAIAEGLDLEARLGNPTGGGIHAKLYLIRLGDEHWSAVGSLNGGEVSHKLNREVLLLTDAPPIYARLSEVFAWDWARSQ